ncbi:MAG: hypothetical protein RJA70_2863 [Pseudomonadota bacterium]|jgi:hypothetical protein
MGANLVEGERTKNRGKNHPVGGPAASPIDPRSKYSLHQLLTRVNYCLWLTTLALL